jgi:DNA-binding NarL/FixJ family response regulator
MRHDLPAARLLIVEDHPLYRDGVVGLLQRAAPQLRCRVADGAPAALRELAAHGDIDLVLADLRLPGAMDGFELLAEVGRQHPTAARVLVSGSEEPHLAERARRAGLMGYLPKRLEPAAWLQALGAILAGECWFPSHGPAPEPPPTERQLHVLQMLAAGRGNKEIARALGITERTVKYHLAQVYGRLGAGNRTEAVSLAGARGWIRLGAG